MLDYIDNLYNGNSCLHDKNQWEIISQGKYDCSSLLFWPPTQRLNKTSVSGEFLCFIKKNGGGGEGLRVWEGAMWAHWW